MIAMIEAQPILKIYPLSLVFNNWTPSGPIGDPGVGLFEDIFGLNSDDPVRSFEDPRIAPYFNNVNTIYGTDPAAPVSIFHFSTFNVFELSNCPIESITKRPNVGRHNVCAEILGNFTSLKGLPKTIRISPLAGFSDAITIGYSISKIDVESLEDATKIVIDGIPQSVSHSNFVFEDLPKLTSFKDFLPIFSECIDQQAFKNMNKNFDFCLSNLKSVEGLDKISSIYSFSCGLNKSVFDLFDLLNYGNIGMLEITSPVQDPALARASFKLTDIEASKITVFEFQDMLIQYFTEKELEALN
jgi:hypothetical protein